MPPEKSAIPPNSEVERQLEKMLANERFRSRPQQTKVLECIVRGALAGEEITEKYIRSAVFPSPPYKAESNIARRTVDLVRELLKEYYAEEGKADLVVISLPESPPGRRIKFQAGHAYKPIFSYNSRHADSRKFRLGLHFLREKSPEAISHALRYLHEVALSQREHAAAHIALVEGLCAMSIYVNRSSPEAELFSVALQIAQDAIELMPDDWHTHAAYGAVLLCCHEVRMARKEFDAALCRDKGKTQNYTWYHAFLFTIGERQPAIELVKLHAEEFIESSYAKTSFGIYLYILRRFQEAEETLKGSLTLDRNYWLTHLSLAALYLSMNRPDEALSHYEQVQLLVGTERSQWTMPGLAILCAMRANQASEAKRKWTRRWAEELLVNIDKSVDWFQAALACIALGESKRAVWSLQRAHKARHPLVLCLDWPILDPIRNHSSFQALANYIRSQVSQ